MKLIPLQSDNPLLRTSCLPLTKKDLRDQHVQEQIDAFIDFVYGGNNKGKERHISKPITVGLSANQVGIGKRISIVDLAIGKKMFNDIHVLINPEIIWHSKSFLEWSEGCVNLPHTFGFVKRYKLIKVKAMDRSGNEILLNLQGWSAILLQHEIGHLNGELFIDHLENPKQAHLVEDGDYKLYKRKKKEWEKYVDVTGLVKGLVIRD